MDRIEPRLFSDRPSGGSPPTSAIGEPAVQVASIAAPKEREIPEGSADRAGSEAAPSPSKPRPRGLYVWWLVVGLIVAGAGGYQLTGLGLGQTGSRLSVRDQDDLLRQCMDQVATRIQAQVRSRVCIGRISFSKTVPDSMGGLLYFYGQVPGMIDAGWLYSTFSCRVARNGAVLFDGLGSQIPNYRPPRDCVAVY